MVSNQHVVDDFYRTIGNSQDIHNLSNLLGIWISFLAWWGFTKNKDSKIRHAIGNFHLDVFFCSIFDAFYRMKEPAWNHHLVGICWGMPKPWSTENSHYCSISVGGPLWTFMIHLLLMLHQICRPNQYLRLVLNYMCQGVNSDYLHMIGDKLINPIVGVYIPTKRIPYERWDDHPQYKEFRPWHVWN